MTRLRRYGELAWLVEPDDPTEVLGLATAVGDLDGVAEVVPAARTVLVRVSSPSAFARLASSLLDLRGEPADSAPGGDVELRVRYDGPDLADTADELGLDPDGLVRAHTAGSYAVAFCGFVPGFAYLRGLDDALHVARLAEPRTRVPAGSVGIAGEFSGVYPRVSPGGWRLLGTTDAALWDADRDPPALLPPGTAVRFRAVP